MRFIRILATVEPANLSLIEIEEAPGAHTRGALVL